MPQPLSSARTQGSPRSSVLTAAARATCSTPPAGCWARTTRACSGSPRWRTLFLPVPRSASRCRWPRSPWSLIIPPPSCRSLIPRSPSAAALSARGKANFSSTRTFAASRTSRTCSWTRASAKVIMPSSPRGRWTRSCQARAMSAGRSLRRPPASISTRPASSPPKKN